GERFASWRCERKPRFRSLPPSLLRRNGLNMATRGQLKSVEFKQAALSVTSPPAISEPPAAIPATSPVTMQTAIAVRPAAPAAAKGTTAAASPVAAVAAKGTPVAPRFTAEETIL